MSRIHLIVKQFLLLLFSLLSVSSLIAQISFSDPIFITRRTHAVQKVVMADLDNDGDQDLITGSEKDDRVAWFENVDGLGKFGPIRVIGIIDNPMSLFSTDADGDGDNDLFFTSEWNNEVGWYENTDGEGNFGTKILITSTFHGATSLHCADIDGDDDPDVLAAANGGHTIAWFENNGQGNFGSEQVITTDAQEAKSVYSADLDGDGDLDALSASFFDDKIAWYENTDGLGTFGPQQVITTQTHGAMYVFSADLDGDNDNDVLSASWWDNEIAWYENTDGLGNFGPQQILTNDANQGRAVICADIDDDNDNDILYCSSGNNNVAWFENTDGFGNFGEVQIISLTGAGPRSIYSTDIDGDNDLDVVAGSWYDSRVAWYENLDGEGSFSDEHTVTLELVDPKVIYSIDIDGDNHNDVLTASWFDGFLAWYENMDGLGGFGSINRITTNKNYITSIFGADLDGDGDNDILTSSDLDNLVTWYENTDGLGNFGPPVQITNNASGASSVFSVDIDGDGDFDVLSASKNDNKIAWYENTDGKGNFGTQQIITTDASHARSVFSADVDGDGDFDVLSASLNDHKIAWYENTDGNGTFGQEQVISTNALNAIAVFSIDLDNDSDNDVISASFFDNKIAWYENTDGNGNFGNEQILSTNAIGASSVFSIDLDGDGDNDIISASQNDGKIAYYENLDGFGNFSDEQVITNAAEKVVSVFGADLDNDGDGDVLSAAFIKEETVWYRNGDVSTGNQEELTDLSGNQSANLKVYPNPFNRSATISFEIKKPGIVQLQIINNYGQMIHELIDDKLTQGSHSYHFEANGISHGIYFVRLIYGDGLEQRKIMVFK